eukprot:scaffold231220_cov24-Tisochrysis_lutea.AAC.1
MHARDHLDMHAFQLLNRCAHSLCSLYACCIGYAAKRPFVTLALAESMPLATVDVEDNRPNWQAFGMLVAWSGAGVHTLLSYVRVSCVKAALHSRRDSRQMHAANDQNQGVSPWFPLSIKPNGHSRRLCCECLICCVRAIHHVFLHV